MSEKIRSRALSMLMMDLAHEDMGIYPAAVVSNGTETKRTEWQDGWNAYGMELTQKASAVARWFKSIPEDHKRDVEDLLLDQTLSLCVNGEEISMQVDSSDLFAWGYSNSDEVKFEDLPELKRALQDSPNYGGILWVCRREKLRPQKPYYKYFSKEEKKLFDACGEKYGWAA